MDTTPAPAPMPEEAKPKTSYGAIVGLLIIVAAIVVGALYFLKERVGDDVYTTDPAALVEQGTSTDPDAIQADLDARSSDDFDREIDQAFVEMDAALQ
jgi:hypothetical protein